MNDRSANASGFSANDPIYRITDLAHAYDGRTVLRVPELAINAGGIIGLAGPNGGGKSTLLRLLGFVDMPTQGAIHFCGKPAHPYDDHVRFQVALLPQDAYLLRRTVAENIRYGLSLRGLQAEAEGRISEVLYSVGLDPDRFAGRQWSALSGGEARRVAMAARLALRPLVLLLDEPTAGVDVDSAERMKSAALHARDTFQSTVLIASHDWQWLYDVCDRVFHLHRGRIFDCGPMATVRGPWDLTQPMGSCRPTADGQLFVAPGAPDANALALVDACAVSILDPKALIPPSALCAQVTRLIYAHRPGRIIVGMDAGGVSLMAWADASTSIHIGQKIHVTVALKGIHWHCVEAA